MSICAARVSCGILLHGAFPRASHRVFGVPAPRAGGEDESDFKVALCQKVSRSLQFLGDRDLQGKQRE
eukprot:11203705-Lingulodinium_polyedra.AAC.1